MDLSTKVLGTHAVDVLTEAHRDHVLTIGADKFTRRDLAVVECFNYVAARNLSAACAALRVKNARDLFEHYGPAELAVLPRIGVIALAVLGAAFQAKKLGGEAPLEAWAGAGDKKIVTYSTIKAREHDRERNERRNRKRKGG